jgi:hypothetical protein
VQVFLQRLERRMPAQPLPAGGDEVGECAGALGPGST